MFPAHAAAQLPLQLSPEQRDAYTEVAQCVRDHTIAMYEAHVAHTSNDSTAPAFDPREWKLLKKKENFQIFASRKKLHATTYQSPTAYHSDIHKSAEWRPQCLLQSVGSFAGSLDDALYGAAVPTDTIMMAKSIAMHDEFIDHQTLCDITVPTEDEPFAYVGLKWSARPPYLASMVRPRDSAIVHSAGFCVVSHGTKRERAGFQVYHSIENIPGVPEFKDYSFRRFRFSLCEIFVPTGTGKIDVFSVMAADAGGDLPRKLTIFFTAAALMSIYNAADNALQKKLVALRSDHAKLARMPSLAPTLGDATTTIECSQCTRKLSVLHPLKRCGVCRASKCSRCMTTQRLVLGHSKATLRPTNVPTCTGCLATASNLDPRELAIMEFVRPVDSDDTDSRSSTQSISTDVSRGFATDSFFGMRFLSFSGSESGSDQYSDDHHWRSVSDISVARRG